MHHELKLGKSDHTKTNLKVRWTFLSYIFFLKFPSSKYLIQFPNNFYNFALPRFLFLKPLRFNNVSILNL